MDKLESLKYKIANDKVHPKRSSLNKMSFRAGFDAAMGLELPVKFMDWALENKVGFDYRKGIKRLIYDSTFWYPKQLYNYWLENIYQPE